ncbi:hypothetical protein BGE01nite_03450 [Brevifollis gellanilyticus]|uniref:Uncharacterized protein n=2 Tax=Brevifollis gellanilyticus TaxID=748831 RepID=A0A512M2T5_9BACT|nr:hypothetical protein BGE01nite_03450 [Brevifollis gellanilyticus]
MRNLSFGMMGVQILTYVIADRQFAEFVDHFVMITSTISAATTELWAWTRRNFWMVIASVLIQITAILIFFVLVGLMSQFLRGPGVFFIAALPLAGSLAAWRNFGAYTKILRLHQKK